jgi:hypothetical protein
MACLSNLSAVVTLSVLLLLLPQSPVSSATLRVPSEYSTINQALDASVSGDTVLVAPGTYTDYEVRVGPFGLPISACAHLKGGVTLLSEAGPESTILERVEAEFNPDVIWSWVLTEKAWVEGFTVTTDLPEASGVVLWESAKTTLKDCIFRDLGTGLANEGAVGVGRCDVDVIGCKFLNINGGTGAAIGQSDGTLLVEDCWFENCQKGAIGCREGLDTRERRAVFRNTTFLNNSNPSSAGGAVYVQRYDSVVIESCWFEGNVAYNGGGAVRIAHLEAPTPTEIRDCVFLSNETLEGLGGGLKVSGDSNVTGNTFFNCSQGYSFGGSAAAFYGGHTEFHRNILASCPGGSAVILRTGTINSDCNVFWDNPDGDVENFSMGPNDRIVDPLFCDPEAGDLEVQAGSPCLPEHSGGCGQIGAFGVGCGSVSVESVTWGRLKNLYRGRGEP